MISFTLVLATGVKLIMVPFASASGPKPPATLHAYYNRTAFPPHKARYLPAVRSKQPARPAFRQRIDLRLQYDADMKHKVTLIPGEGIGPEVASATKRIIEASGVQIEWEELAARTDSATEAGQLVNQKAIDSVRRNHVALKGPTSTAIAGGAPSVNVALRKALDLYANLRPVKNLPGVKSRFENVDIVLVRENTEDLYSGLEHEVVPGVVESLKIITERASTRIARFAFEYAKKSARKKIHAIHKANIMKLSDGLFLKSLRAVAERYKDIEYKEMIVDNACMQMVLDPQQFDMLLLPNLYGDVMSDLAAGLVGGLGVVPSGNIGDDCAMFEAVHGTAPDIAGKGLANPTALVMSGIMMLDHLGERPAARRIEAALEKVYREGQHATRDLGGRATTQEFTEAVISALPVAATA
jgi:isocitrate dehydrogenase (NAD+)